MLAIRAEEKGLELACDVAPGVAAMVVGVPGRLRQVLVNLVGNAIKFTERGEVVLRAEPVSETEDEVRLSLAVTDTGIGIPEEERRRIFDAFEQVDGSTTRRYGGTGLGLAICSQLVKLMGGELSVESEIGRGSAFHFTASFGRVGPETRPQALREPSSLRGLRVLVVDDNATNRLILESTVRSWQMSPVTADGAQQALLALAKGRAMGNPFSLILLDGHMPDMDGFDLAGCVKDAA